MFRDNAVVKYALRSAYNDRYVTYIPGNPNYFKSVSELTDDAKFVY